ncbi:alkaline ceramidase-like protein [Lepidopterella palustris CBS 459.81]|uniref:Alkaline ceramidase-like protein n=1 Tax=Lepidopterella palustris CBS 459.81 TaxID=1314670 RepID=A0A8E2JKE6_9PEZI|nr:alkaline ceramidase-like protein [Lepidopterella palustris CBS 459.81]
MVANLLSWLPSVPYPPSQEGWWSPVTSTLNWCEEDYYATIYSAEIVNTLTNLLFMYLAGKGINNCLKHGHDTIFLVTFVGYMLVGTGSFLFHATLKYPMQLIDELSMIYTTCLMFYATFSFGRSRIYSIFLGIFLVSLSLFITLYYHYLQDPAFHQNAYALLTAIVVFRSMWVMEVNIRPSFRAKWKAHAKPNVPGTVKVDQVDQDRQDKRDKEILSQMWTLVACGISIFIGGFGIWTLDNEFCPTIRQWRRQIGLPWGILLEGHGWWHLMTGIGAYFYIVWGIWLRHCLNYRQDEYELKWPRITSLPLVVRQQNPSAGKHQNGSVQKDVGLSELQHPLGLTLDTCRGSRLELVE